MATFFNQATLSYSGGTVNSNVTTGEIVEVLSATKTAVEGNYTQGSDVTYAINVVNSGITDFNGLSITDDLGGYTFNNTTLYPLDYVTDSVKLFVNGVLQPAPTVTTATPLTVTNISIPAGAVATLLYTVRVNEYAPLATDSTITNTAVVNGAGVTALSASETIEAVTEPILSISKSVSPSTVSENGRLTYTFVIQNTGNTEADASDNIVITDTFDPTLSNITVTYNGEVWTSPLNYTYNEATGLFTTTAGAITVPAATFTVDPSGIVITDPGVATLTVSGTI